MLSLFDKNTQKQAIGLFAVMIAFLWLFGYNISYLGINYNGIIWDWRGGLLEGYAIDLASATYFDRENFLANHGFTGYNRLYHIAVLLHVIYAVLLFKPTKRALSVWKAFKGKNVLTKAEFNQVSWSLFIVVMFVLNILLVIHESNATFLTDITDFAAPYRPNAQLHYESILYLDGRGWIFVLLTALYPSIIYLDKKLNKA